VRKGITDAHQRGIGVILQYMQMALNIVISLIYTPAMLRILGQSEYGIYNLAASTISYLNLISLGFGASYIRYYSIFKKEKKDIGSLNYIYLLTFSAMSLIAIACGLFLVGHVEWFYNYSYSINEVNIARKLMIILIINLAISFPASLFSSYVTSQERFVFQKLLNMGKTILSPALNIVFLFLGFGSIGMAVVTTVVSFLVDIINIIFCFNKLEMRITVGNADFYVLRDMFSFSLFIAINQLIDQINWQTDKIILGKMVNGVSVAIYAVGSQINAMFTSFSTAISSVFAPKIHRIVQQKEKDANKQLTNLFIRVGRIQFYLLSLILTGFIFFGMYFVKSWAGEAYANAYYIALLLMTPAMVPLIQNIGIEIQRAMNMHKFRSVIYLIMAVLNVAISIWLVSLWKEIGAAIGTTISLLVANGILMNCYYHIKMKINVIQFWKSIGTILPGYLLPIAFGLLTHKYINIDNLFMFIICVVAYTIVFMISIYLFSFNDYEKNLVHRVFRKLLMRGGSND